MEVCVIGAGIVGLSTSFELARSGAQVVVVDRGNVGDGASHGNAGHILPAMIVPFASPHNLRASARSLIRSRGAIRAPFTTIINNPRFVAEFALKSRSATYHENLRSLAVLSSQCVKAFEDIEKAGVKTTRSRGPFVSCFRKPANAHALIEEYYEAAFVGAEETTLRFYDTQGTLAREPIVDPRTRLGIELSDQSFVDPPQLVQGLKEAAQRIGCSIRERCRVRTVQRHDGRVTVRFEDESARSFDRVVIATGAGLETLARPHLRGLRLIGGVGHSLFVPCDRQPRGMLYFPELMLAVTRFRSGIRVSSLIELQAEPPYVDRDRIDVLRALGRQAMPQLNWTRTCQHWAGARPLPYDGMPIIGETATPGVYVNGGHGMWGVSLGPVSAKYIADQITRSSRLPALPRCLQAARFA